MLPLRHHLNFSFIHCQYGYQNNHNRNRLLYSTCYQIKQDFASLNFYDEETNRIATPTEEIVEKFEQITGIEERRYAPEEMNSSDMAIIAAKLAIEDSGIDPEELDQIILAQNFGNVMKHTIQTDILPALASRVKHGLGIKNPNCVAYDLIFGCPGWVQELFRPILILKLALQKSIDCRNRNFEPGD